MANAFISNLQDYTSTRLGSRLSIDVASAAFTAAIISPIVCLIDSTIMMKAASTASFSTCLGKMLQPWNKIHRNLIFTKPFALVFMVYFGTYSTANSADTISSVVNRQPADTVSSSTPKFLATATISTGLTVYKDSRLAQLLGGSVRKSPVPLASYCLFTMRDAITIFASFNMPPLIAPKLSGIIESEVNRLRTAQFLLPVGLQFISTPIHLLGLDLYNRKAKLGMADRLDYIRRDIGTAIPARMIRIIPAFGVGGVVNNSVRTAMMQNLDSGI